MRHVFRGEKLPYNKFLRCLPPPGFVALRKFLLEIYFKGNIFKGNTFKKALHKNFTINKITKNSLLIEQFYFLVFPQRQNCRF